MAEDRVPAAVRQEVSARARDCCECCRSQSRFAMQPFSVEHVVPRGRDGETTVENLTLSCQGCNNHQYSKTHGRDPVTGGLVPLYHPRRLRWCEHLNRNDDCTLILGLTPTGRATVETLRLNRDGLVNLRRVLFACGEHPPRGRGNRRPTDIRIPDDGFRIPEIVLMSDVPESGMFHSDCWSQ